MAQDRSESPLAIKCLKDSPDPKTVERLRREFAILHGLSHPNIAPSLDFGKDSTTGQYLLVSQYVAGQTLAEILPDQDDPACLKLLAQVLKALKYLHRHGVIHGDLKPANLLVTPSGQIKLIDFDIATEGPRILGGSPHYLAPEILDGRESHPSPRTDLYALGVTFYECLTHRLPFTGQTLEELRHAQSTQEAPQPTRLNPRLAAHWDGILLGMLQKDPAMRFASASAVLAQVLLALGKPERTFEKEEILFRLHQAGTPFGKGAALERIKGFLEEGLENHSDPEKAWLLQGESGLGNSYFLQEVKAQAQMADLPCVEWNLNQQNFPQEYPFVWLVDDLFKLHRGEAQEKISALVGKVREIFFQGQGRPWWILFGDIPNIHLIPPQLRTLIQDIETRVSLTPWTPNEIKSWAEEIFQSQQIPQFLLQKLSEGSGGNPGRAHQLLQYYLERDLLFDRAGNWRKDLYRPNKIFQNRFDYSEGASPFHGYLSRLPTETKKLLIYGALLYRPVAPEFFEALLKSPQTYPLLKKFMANGTFKENADGTFYFANAPLKNYLLRHLPQKELQKRHDRILSLASQAAFASYFSTNAKNYHLAQGADGAQAAQAWKFFGETCARHGLWDSALDYFQKALERTPESDREGRLEYSIRVGQGLIGTGRLSEARQYYEDLLIEFSDQRSQRPELFAKIFERLGVIESKQTHLGKAKEFFYQGLTCLDPNYEPLEQHLALRNFLAGLELREGNLGGAIEEYQETYRIAQEKLPWEKRRILTNNDLGEALLKAGQRGEAFAHWQTELKDYENREDKGPLVRVLYQMGKTYLEAGNAELALVHLEKAQIFCEALHNFELESRIHNALASLYRPTDPEKSLIFYEKALGESFQTQDAYSTAIILINMGYLLEEMKNWPRARHCLSQGLLYLKEAREQGEEIQKLGPIAELQEQVSQTLAGLAG